jgi:hypothetical protein
MAQISTYDNSSAPTIDDKVIGTNIENENVTKNFEISQILSLLNEAIVVLPLYTDNTSALQGGLIAGQLYRTPPTGSGSFSVVCVVY